jgi:hypothetical protein
MRSVSRTPCEVMRKNNKASQKANVVIVNDKANGLGGGIA